MRRIVIAILVVVVVAAGAATAVVLSTSNSTNSAHGARGMPSVSTTFGHTPQITFPESAAPGKLSATVLQEGTGPVVARGDLVIANYVGQIWRGKVFDTTFDKPVPDAFQIGMKRVIAGWDMTMVGKRVGSRLLLVIPPADGYGSRGLPTVGITGKDTIVYVVDLLGAYGAKVAGDLHATVLGTGMDGVVVSGAPGTKPTITFAKKEKAPKSVVTMVLDLGHGPPLKPGFVVIQGVEQSWDGGVEDSTWADKTPAAVPVGVPSEPGLLDSLVGTPIGSRVLILAPASSNETPATAAVIDLIAELKGTAAQSK